MHVQNLEVKKTTAPRALESQEYLLFTLQARKPLNRTCLEWPVLHPGGLRAAVLQLPQLSCQHNAPLLSPYVVSTALFIVSFVESRYCCMYAAPL